MELVLIAVGAATIDAEKDEVTDDGITVDATGWVGAAGWVVFVASVAVITEFMMLLLHFLNPSHFNNHYRFFGGMVSNLTSLQYDTLDTFIHRILPSVLWLVSVCLLGALSPEWRLQ